jgi:riboflavin kinase / FMN adenylyltransferase
MTAQVFRGLEEVAGKFGPSCVAIGNFDGVHVGHRTLIEATVRRAGELGVVPAALTFDPHPSVVVAPNRTPQMICSLEDRLQLLSDAGAKRIFVLPFTQAVAHMSPREFVWQILVNSLEAKVLTVGRNFRFGHRQAGNPEVLKSLGQEFGFESQFLSPVTVRGQVVSSSLIREQIAEGRVSKAGRLLGHCYSVAGPVVSGHGVGAKQTVPTLNIRPIPGQVLPRGVFITETLDEASDRRWHSITNVGTRPTFGGDELNIETYLLTALEGASPERIRVRFLRFLRNERQFPNPEALKQQILRDVRQANTFWRRFSELKKLSARI